MLVTLYSYSIKYRTEPPVLHSNYTFDCRGVKNPGRVETLKPLTGLDQDVIDFLNTENSAQNYWDGLQKTVIDTFNVFLSRTDTPEMKIGFCCTGGRHRSVYFCERMANALTHFENVTIEKTHFDMDANYY
jgi:UPF0042 nucleotide-binding protein